MSAIRVGPGVDAFADDGFLRRRQRLRYTEVSVAGDGRANGVDHGRVAVRRFDENVRAVRGFDGSFNRVQRGITLRRFARQIAVKRE